MTLPRMGYESNFLPDGEAIKYLLEGRLARVTMHMRREQTPRFQTLLHDEDILLV